MDLMSEDTGEVLGCDIVFASLKVAGLIMPAYAFQTDPLVEYLIQARNSQELYHKAIGTHLLCVHCGVS